MIDEACIFRLIIQDARNNKKVSWRVVFENGDINATMTTVRSDMSITTGLKSLMPQEFVMLMSAENLPDLENFAISLYPLTKSCNRLYVSYH